MQVFNRNNLNSVLNKTPLICYYSENGACGPSGLFFVIFNDNSIYAYSTYYKKSDRQLINEIAEHVPEFAPLIGLDGEFNFKRESTTKNMELFYLGLGNFAYIHNSILEEFNQYEGEYLITKFKKLVNKYSNEDLTSIQEMVRKEING